MRSCSWMSGQVLKPAWLIPVETCMVDLRLNDRGEIELAEFGEETAGVIWATCCQISWAAKSG